MPAQNSFRFLACAVLAFGLTGALLASGCSPGGPQSLDELGIVLTQQNPTGRHSGLRTWAMLDTVVELERPDDPVSTPFDRQFDPVILAEIREQMDLAGFRRVDPSSLRPDAWVAVGAVSSPNWSYGDEWGFFGEWWGSGGEPPWNTNIQTANFEQGTVVWVLLDLRELPEPIPPDPSPVTNWVASINGALQSGSASSIETSLRSGIKQAFAQSPYIQADPSGKTVTGEVRP